ncbi:MAG: PD40 domain-containing protein [Deltaproteobacteria bacterium]|nr:PD40 domain-containing protein [Deltaproteobacteria bacterium]
MDQLKKTGRSLFQPFCLFIVLIALIEPNPPLEARPVQKQRDSGHMFCALGDFKSLDHESLMSLVDSFAGRHPMETIRIIEPLDDSIFPPDMASPAFLWEDGTNSSAWLITFRNNINILLRALITTPWWIPDENTWGALQRAAGNDRFEIIIEGIGGLSGRDILSRGSVSSIFSKDRVDAYLMFMRKPLPFLNAKNNPEKTSILRGTLESYNPPETVFSNPPVCANCHSYSLDGDYLAMDTDYKGDKGAFLFSSMDEEIKITNSTIFSWNVMGPEKPATYHMGLFAQVSPDGAYVAGTVNETSVFVMMDDLFFSQLFYPSTGQIAIFDTRTKRFDLLPGASFRDIIQTAPAWRPDGKYIAFARASIDPGLIQKVLTKEILRESPAQDINDLNKKYPVQFDIYAVPFNDGKGGAPEPLRGASGNGCSNYFPRYSPDGKWIVFTQSPTGLVLQPESRLIIIPSEGGEPEQLRCNQAVMNSWHSWSPNSKWLVFTCKANSPYTELYLTHIDEKGDSSPAVRLFRFSSNEFAAMVPEFLPRKTGLTKAIVFDSIEDATGKSMAIDGR